MYLVPKFGQIFELKMANTLTTADDGVGAYSSTIRKCYNEKWQHLQIEKETRLFRMFNFKTEQFTPQHNLRKKTTLFLYSVLARSKIYRELVTIFRPSFS